METLQALAQIVKDLPDTAIYIIGIYFIFKISIVGSIYGVIRFVAQKVHDVMVVQKRRIEEVEIRVLADGLLISDQKDEFMRQIRRLAGVRTATDSEYIHRKSVDFLREALDAQFAKDEATGRKY